MKPYEFSIGDSMKIAEDKMPEGWKVFRWERANGGNLVTGSIPDGVYSRGPRKGRPRWDRRKDEVVVVSQHELEAAAAAYEASSGNCWDCKGTGQTMCAIGPSGTTYRPCGRCDGTGKAVNAADQLVAEVAS